MTENLKRIFPKNCLIDILYIIRNCISLWSSPLSSSLSSLQKIPTQVFPKHFIKNEKNNGLRRDDCIQGEFKEYWHKVRINSYYFLFCYIAYPWSAELPWMIYFFCSPCPWRWFASFSLSGRLHYSFIFHSQTQAVFITALCFILTLRQASLQFYVSFSLSGRLYDSFIFHSHTQAGLSTTLFHSYTQAGFITAWFYILTRRQDT